MNRRFRLLVCALITVSGHTAAESDPLSFDERSLAAQRITVGKADNQEPLSTELVGKPNAHRETFATFIERPGKHDRLELGELGSDQGPISLVLNRFDPIAPDARFVVVVGGEERELARPESLFYRGQASGAVSGAAFLAIHGRDYFAVVDTQTGPLVVVKADGAYAAVPAKLSDDSTAHFQCGVDDHQSLQNPILSSDVASLIASIPSGASFNARLAIETDQEFLARFSGSTTNANNYLSNLVGYMSSLFSTQVDTSIQLSFSRLWTSTDPWVQTNAGCMLLELGKYWNDNMGAETRTMVHMVSGKASLSGIAWLGVLCSGAFNTSPAALGLTCPGISGTSNYGGAYGVTSGISGSFNPGNPVVVWDSLGMTHELGHNFNSPHTHCYGNIGGNVDQVDHCNAGEAGNPGCYSGAQTLPGPAGTGSGTIMSYCHLLSPGLTNITMTFGEGHGFGTAPERVNQRMRSHVQAQATAFPACLAAPQNNNIFLNGFE